MLSLLLFIIYPPTLKSVLKKKLFIATTSSVFEQYLAYNKCSDISWVDEYMSNLEKPLQYSCLENPMDGGAW